MNSAASTSVLALLIGGFALLAASTLPLPCRIAYNPSPSMPIGWYAVGRAGVLHAHDVVLAQLPVDAMALADERRYLPRGVPILKAIGAIEGQAVCLVDGIVSIDGTPLAHTRERDGAGLVLAPWNGCRSLRAGEIFLLGDRNHASFDSRYFGPITRDEVIGKAIPLWTW